MINRVLGALFFLGALYYIGSSINLSLFYEALAKYTFFSVIYIVFVTGGSFFIITLRWQVLTKNFLSFKNAFMMNVILNAINQFLPARAGDLYKPFYNKKHYNLDLFAGASGTILERFFDFLLLFILMIFTVNSIGEFSHSFFVFCGVGGVLGGVVLTIFYPKVFLYVIKKIRYEPIRNFLNSIVEYLSKTPKILLGKALVLSFFLYGFYLFSFYFFTLFFGDFSLDFWSVVVVFTLSTLGVALPSAPGGVGVYEASVIFGMGLYEISPEKALSFALVYHFVQIFTLLIFSGVFYLRGKVE